MAAHLRLHRAAVGAGNDLLRDFRRHVAGDTLLVDPVAKRREFAALVHLMTGQAAGGQRREVALGLMDVMAGGAGHSGAGLVAFAAGQQLHLAGLCGGVSVRVHEPTPTRDHTEQMLSAAGVTVSSADGWITLQPVQSLAPLDLDVPGDPSSAAFFVARALLAERGSIRIENVLRSPFRDGFLHVVRRMGARIVERIDALEGGGSRNALTVEAGASLCGTSVGRDEVSAMIDEIPMLAVLAARAEGETVVRGAEELRVKESDRITAVVSNLRAIGVDADEVPDGLIVRGTRAPLRGHVRTHADHRIAMAFAVLGASRDCVITLDDPECVSVSYPGFWRDLAHVAR